MIISIRKRDGRVVPFDMAKIENAILKAFEASGSAKGQETAHAISLQVENDLENNENISSTPSVEEVQDTVERVLIEKGFVRTAKAYILYRAERSRVREMNTRLMKVFEDIVYKDAVDSDIKRENANINGDTAMGSMLKFGSEGAKQFYDMYVLNPKHAQAHREGDIHIHDPLTYGNRLLHHALIQGGIGVPQKMRQHRLGIVNKNCFWASSRAERTTPPSARPSRGKSRATAFSSPLRKGMA